MSNNDHTDLSLVQKELAKVLMENKIFQTETVNELIGMPEFQILKLLTQFQDLSDQEMEQKYQAPYSLSMILSNLSADGLIEQTGSYKWKISASLSQIIIEFKSTSTDREKERVQVEEEVIIEEERYSKKLEFKKIVDTLKVSPYIPSSYSAIEELFDIPELELLVLINKNQPVSSDDLEKMHSQGSLSLTLSNLKADNLIDETSDYRWKIEDNFNEKLKSVHEITLPPSEILDEGIEDVQSLSTKINLIEQSQFIKMILDINYFENMSLNEMIDTQEFQILNLIYSRGPISVEDLEEELPDVLSFAMLLSNLKIDGLIDQENDYRWKLSNDFRMKMMKIKIDKDEFIEEINLLEKKYKKKEKDTPSLEDKIKIKEIDPAHSQEPQKIEKSEVVRVNIPNAGIQEILIKHNYMGETLVSMDKLMAIPEFEIIRLIGESGAIDHESIEAKARASSVSLTLSNLKADGLIEQTVDYQWTLSETMKKVIDPSLLKTDDIEEVVIERVNEMEITKEEEVEITLDVRKLAVACKKKGYLDNPLLPEDELAKIPEFEVLSVIYTTQPVDTDLIKNIAVSVSPVLISRTLSKLEADNCIVNDASSNYIFSDEFNNLLIEDEIKEQKERETAEVKRVEEERTTRMHELQEDMVNLAEILINDGLVSADSTDPKVLMTIPEFELLAILKKDGAMSIDDLKGKAGSVSPVLISRTISKLEANNMIVRLSGDILILSPELEERIK